MTKTQKITYYVLVTLMTLGFLMAGFPKVTGNEMAVTGFTAAHLPLWFLYFIGAAEIAGAIGLWIPKLQKWAIYGLMIIMVGAIVVSAIFYGISMAIMPLAYLIILAVILKLSKKRGSVAASPVEPIATL